MLQDHVVAIVSEESLWDILPAVRLNGLGHLARVIRPSKRGSISAQLQRAGVPTASLPDSMRDAGIVLLVSAAKRSPATAALMIGHGASRAWIVAASGNWIEVDDTVVQVTPPPPSARVPMDVPGRGAMIGRPAQGDSANGAS